MPKTMWVKAATLADPGLKGKNRCLREGSRKRYITEHEAVEVPASPYYLRKVRLGDLEQVAKPSPKTKPAKSKPAARSEQESTR